MTPGQETPVVGSKKITIHVGGSRGSTTASPAPQSGPMSTAARPDFPTSGNQSFPPPAAATTSTILQVDPKALPLTAGPPPPAASSGVAGAVPQQTPAAFPRPNGNLNGPAGANAPNGMTAPVQNLQQPPPGHQLQNGRPAPAPAPQPVSLIYDFKYRAPGRGMSLHVMSGYPKPKYDANVYFRPRRFPDAEHLASDTSQRGDGPQAPTRIPGAPEGSAPEPYNAHPGPAQPAAAHSAPGGV